jgi:hypothetical protein
MLVATSNVAAGMDDALVYGVCIPGATRERRRAPTDPTEAA